MLSKAVYLFVAYCCYVYAFIILLYYTGIV